MSAQSTLEPVDKLPVRFLKARKVRVKSTPATRVKQGWGLRCRAGYSGEQDNRLWAGEVGEVYCHLVEGNGWDQLELIAEFSRMRRVVIGELVRPDDEGPTADLVHGVWRVAIGRGDDLEKLSIIRE